jgi:small subunit ribosomal protein S8
MPKKILPTVEGRRDILPIIKVLPDRKQGVLRLFMKYQPNKVRVIQGVKRVSRPGLRAYRGYEDLAKVRGGLGMSIVSTSKGLMTDRQSRKRKLGGEVIAIDLVKEEKDSHEPLRKKSDSFSEKVKYPFKGPW